MQRLPLILICSFALLSNLTACSGKAQLDEPSPVEPADAAEAPQPATEHGERIDVMAHMPEHTIVMPSAQKVVLSDFYQANTPKVLRVTTNLRTSKNGKIAGEDLEDRIWNMMLAHTPDPFVLQRAKSMEKGDATWGMLNINFKRFSERLRRASKAAPWRTKATFGLAIDLKLPQNQTSSWTNFDFKFVDEHYADEDLKVNASFWHALENALPTFTAAENAAEWTRSLGLVTSRLSNDVNEIESLPEHRYFSDGCIVYEQEGQTYVRQIDQAFSRPRPLSISSVLALQCSRDLTFVFAQNGVNDIDLHVQPKSSNNSWKTGIHFETPINRENFASYIDEDIICVWNGAHLSASRKSEIHCLDRETGLPRWHTDPVNGMVRGFAATSQALTFVMDQAIFSISRGGSLVYTHRLPPAKARHADVRSCQNEKTLVYSMNAGQLTFLDLASGEITWNLNAFNTEKLFCAQDDVVVFSEAGGYLLGVNSRDLKPLWKYRSVSMPRDMLAFGKSLILLMDRAIIALDTKTGRVQASFGIPVLAEKFIHIGNRIWLDQKNAISPLRIK